MDIEGHFGKKVVMNSGYRTPAHNAEVGGAEDSYHKKCMAADFFIPGVPKSQLIAYARRCRWSAASGCYPGRDFIHIDVRSRPWGAKGPVTFAAVEQAVTARERALASCAMAANHPIRTRHNDMRPSSSG